MHAMRGRAHLLLLPVLQLGAAGHDWPAAAARQTLCQRVPRTRAAAGSPLDPDKRRRLMASRKNRAGLSFAPGRTWTLHFWQHLLDAASCKLDLTIARINAAKYLGDMPIRVWARTRQGAVLWDLELWHRSQLQHWPAQAPGLP